MSAEVEKLIAEIEAGLDGVQGGPYQLDDRSSYIWAPDHIGGVFPIGDDVGRDEAGVPVMRLRGWGYYTGHGHGGLGLPAQEAEARQRRTGEHLARMSPGNVRAILDHIGRLQSSLASAIAERDEALAQVAAMRAATIAECAEIVRRCTSYDADENDPLREASTDTVNDVRPFDLAKQIDALGVFIISRLPSPDLGTLDTGAE